MGAYGGYGGGMSGMPSNGVMDQRMGPYMSDEFQQAGGYGGGMASNGVMPAGNFQGGFSGYGGRLNQPWETTQANMGKLFQAMSGGAEGDYQTKLQNAWARSMGRDMAQLNPGAYADLQAIVAKNHPNWNQNQINRRAALRLGRGGGMR